MENYKVSELINKKYLDIISESEDKELLAWLGQSEKNRDTYQRIISKIQQPYHNSFDKKDIVEADWSKVRRSLNIKNSSSPIIYMIARIAAAVIVVSGLSYLAIDIIETIGRKDIIVAEASVKPGTQKAILVLEDGQKVDLINTEKNEIEQTGAVISLDKKELAYKIDGLKAETIKEEIYNTLIIPKAGEYSFTLSDGTKVWINSDTKLKYPVNFIGDKRVIYLEGEAYFEVKRNEKKPFIVKTFDELNVEVLGTKFNVDAYKENEIIKTTLLSGKVRVSKGKQNTILKLDQQAVLNRQSNKIIRKEVDAYRFVAWKDGKFLFEDERLEDIMVRLSRWYGVEVFFMNQEVKDFHFTGDLERYGNISKILSMIEKATNIKFRIKNKSIIVSSN